MKRLALVFISCCLFFSLQPVKQVSAYSNYLFTELNDYVACDGNISHAIYATKHPSTVYMQGFAYYYINGFFEEALFFPETTGYIDEEFDIYYPDTNDMYYESYVVVHYYSVANGYLHGDGTWLDSSSTLTPTCQVTLDTQAPTAPSNLQYLSLDNSKLIKWNASTDNFLVKEYRVYNYNDYIGTTTGTAYSFSSTNYPDLLSVTVKAVDYAGNISAASDPLLVGELQYNYLNGRLETITYKNTTIVLYQYTYDDNGNLLKVEVP